MWSVVMILSRLSYRLVHITEIHLPQSLDKLTREYSQMIHTDSAHTPFVARTTYIHNGSVSIRALTACMLIYEPHKLCYRWCHHICAYRMWNCSLLGSGFSSLKYLKVNVSKG